MTRQSFSVEGMRRRTEVAVDRAWNAIVASLKNLGRPATRTAPAVH